MLKRLARGLAVGIALTWGVDSAGAQRTSRDRDADRKRMVDEQLKGRDIRNARVFDAMLKVPRHLFVPEDVRDEAYLDGPLPIGHGQTISQPYIVAFMTEALDVQPAHRVLEIGTGSGYQAAVLSTLAERVYTIEIVAPLADRARATLQRLGYRNVDVRTGNGYLGWPEEAPFDRIMVTAAPDEVPRVLVDQLKIGGLMVIPVGTLIQELRILRRTATGIEVLGTLPVRFVPMTGKPKPLPHPFVSFFGCVFRLRVLDNERQCRSRAGPSAANSPSFSSPAKYRRKPTKNGTAKPAGRNCRSA